MSLIPRLPCRKLFIDRRYALPGGTATKFEVEVPQGGIDCPDNCVAFIDQISVPSFPNTFVGRNRIYFREWQASSHKVRYRYVELPEQEYDTLAALCTGIQSALTAASVSQLANSYQLSPDGPDEQGGAYRCPELYRGKRALPHGR